MVVVHKSLAQQFVRYRDKHEGVRRVGGMNDVKSLAKVHEQGQNEHRHRRIAILEQVAHDAARFRQRRIPVGAHSVDGLPPWLSRPRRGDDGDLVSGIGQCPGLAAHTSVLGVGVVLYQHKHAPTGGRVRRVSFGLHRLGHVSILRCAVRCHLELPPGRIMRAAWLAG